MGDNIYGDSEDMGVIRAKYEAQFKRPGYVKLRQVSEIIGTWDDHDFGANNAGKEFSAKAGTKRELLRFLEVPKSDPRWTRPGVYSVRVFEQEGLTVKVILLDARWFREKPGPKADILGEAQWAWLRTELAAKGADVHVIVSGIQVLAEEHRFEKWGEFPLARERLLDLLREPEMPAVVFLSGDRHLAEISVLKEAALGYSLYDITSSSLNRSFGGIPDEVNSLREGRNFGGTNFGLLEISQDAEGTPSLLAQIRDAEGEVVRATAWKLERKLAAQPGSGVE